MIVISSSEYCCEPLEEGSFDSVKDKSEVDDIGLVESRFDEAVSDRGGDRRGSAESRGKSGSECSGDGERDVDRELRDASERAICSWSSVRNARYVVEGLISVKAYNIGEKPWE